MIKRKRSVAAVAAGVFAAFVLAMSGCASGGSSPGSEVTVMRVDSNQLVNLRVYLDGKSRGVLKVGSTASYKIPNGPHTIRVGFEDYQARSTEVASFVAYNSLHVFSVTDNSIVLMREEQLPVGDDISSTTAVVGVAPPPVEPVFTQPYAVESVDGAGLNLQTSSVTVDNAIRSAFDKTTKSIDKKKKIAVINVDADNTSEGNYILEEITLLGVNSPKNFRVVDRRWFDAFRAKNSIGLPSFENDYELRLIGQQMGADYVITGRLDGPGDLRRLRIKALEVATGDLVGNSSERLN